MNIPDHIIQEAAAIVARYRSEAPAGCDPQCKGGAPQVNKKMERMQMQLLEKQLKESQMQMPEMPTLAEPPKAAPPPTMGSSDQVEAQQEQRRQSGQRMGYKATLLAGETGGFKSTTPLGASSTLLGS